MISQRSVIVLALLALVAPGYGKVFSRCELAVELVNQGLPRARIADWVCLVEAESSRNTGAVGGPNSNGSYDYGLFQINDGFWCSTTSSPGKDCNVRCANLTNDNISDDVACAKIIYNRHGFSAWYGWANKCQGSLPDVSSCF